MTAGRARFDAWIESSMVRVYPRTPPPAAAQELSVSLALAAGEYQSFQIVLRPREGSELRNVRVETRPLTGSTSIAASNIEWHQVGYVRVGNLDYNGIAANAELAKASGAELPGWWPDPLLPVESFNVGPEFAQPLWMTVYAPPGTPAGECSGAVVITPENARPVTANLSVTVHPFALPLGAGNFPSAFALSEDELRRVYGRLDERMRLQWGDFVLKHRINPGSIYCTEPPVVSDLEHYLEGGMNGYNVIYNSKGTNSPNLADGSPQVLEKVAAFLDALSKSPHHQRLFDMAYYYGFDEVTAENLDALRVEFRNVRERFGLPTFTTSHVPQTPADLRKLNIDWLCPITYWLKPDMVARCRQEGFKMWTYVSLEPYLPYPNVRFDCPLIESRLLFWQVCREQLDGFLYWGLNAWRSEGNDRPIDLSRGPLLDWDVTSKWRWSIGEQSWLHGDGRLLYPGPDGPMGCIRLANMRDGIQDWEYLRLLAQVTGRPADAVRACEPVTTGLTQYSRDPRVLESQRALIAQQILEG